MNPLNAAGVAGVIGAVAALIPVVAAHPYTSAVLAAVGVCVAIAYRFRKRNA